MPPTEMAVEMFCGPIRAEIEARRSTGLKTAFAEVSRFFGLSERRIRAVWNGEVRVVLAWELLQVRQRMRAALDERQSRLNAELESVGQAIRALAQHGG